MKTRLLILTATIACVLLSTGIGLAQGGYDLSWWTVDSGGRTFSSGGEYTLGGTVGQPDAGLMSDSSGTYTLSGGFWGGVGPVEYEIYLPLVLRNS